MNTSLGVRNPGEWTTITGMCGLIPVFTGMFKPKTIRAKRRPGRNDLCPCGKWKKYKHCCGARS